MLLTDLLLDQLLQAQEHEEREAVVRSERFSFYQVFPTNQAPWAYKPRHSSVHMLCLPVPDRFWAIGDQKPSNPGTISQSPWGIQGPEHLMASRLSVGKTSREASIQGGGGGGSAPGCRAGAPGCSNKWGGG